MIYQGIVSGLKDLGRDLIATKKGHVHVIQCKYWRKERTIHEKHIFQLYGTTVEYYLKNTEQLDQTQCDEKEQYNLLDIHLTNNNIRPVFITTTQLSEWAKKFAKHLNVEVRELLNYDPNYPMVKCNISRSTKEKIYHLPMDQQYDNTIIEPATGELYVQTAIEAERLGFRRAWRWRGKDRSSE